MALFNPQENVTRATKTRKTAAKTTATKTNGKGPGVIATIIACIDKANGATADEMLTVLKSKFPVMIQANKNAKRKDQSEKQGLI